MSVLDIIRKRATQTMVYWGSPTSDGYGGNTYADAEELACIWEEKQKIILDSMGKELVSLAVVFVNQDLDIGGLLYLGSLDDLDSNALPPSETYEILSEEKLKGFASGDYVRVYYLGKN
jgi:hypothetical protein